LGFGELLDSWGGGREENVLKDLVSMQTDAWVGKKVVKCVINRKRQKWQHWERLENLRRQSWFKKEIYHL